MMKTIFLFIISLVIFTGTVSASNDHVGVIVKKQGQVELLTNPSDKVEGKGPHVLFEGKYYSSESIRLGIKLTNGSVLRTGKGAKVKIVYKNGDQINVAEGTAYRVTWKQSAKKGEQNAGAINLMYGSIRGIINKKGPRSGMQVKTKQAVMGIRGTDFHIAQQGTSGVSSLSVLRGKVEIVDRKNTKNKVSVGRGFSAEIKQVAKNESTKETISFEVVKTTKNELVEIQKNSELKQDQKELENISRSLKQQLVELQNKATENTLSDIKEYDLEMYQDLKDKKINDVDKINTVVVGNIFENAPTKKVKAGIDYDELEEDAYKKYFKVE